MVKTFLITFKPLSENFKSGWPLENLQALVRRLNNGEQAQEEWRFRNSKASEDDRVFLLLQGKQGPAIIGYGRTSGRPYKDSKKDKWMVTVRFESLIDPSKEAPLANKKDLFLVKDKNHPWYTQHSGREISDDIAAELERLLVFKVGKDRNDENEKLALNPDWTRDELILALNVYLKYRPNPPSKTSEEIRDLSRKLNRLGEKLFLQKDRASTFRNENGVYMKLMNFRRLDPLYTAEGRKGLERGAKTEEEVWKEFASEPERCQQAADAIMAILEDPEGDADWFRMGVDEGVQEAAEGRLLTHKHLIRERKRELVESKKKQAKKKYGKLICEICDFDFEVYYGEHGRDFIECHHTKPLATLVEGQKTHIDDLILVCANCHRMLHRGKSWLSVAELKAILQTVRRASPGSLL